MPHPTEPPELELLSLFTGLAEVTKRAMEALAGDGVEELPALIDQRGELLARIGPQLQRLQSLQRRSGGAALPEVAAAQRAGAALQAQNQRLLEALVQRRDDAALELLRMDRANAARAAYTRPSPTPSADSGR